MPEDAAELCLVGESGVLRHLPASFFSGGEEGFRFFQPAAPQELSRGQAADLPEEFTEMDIGEGEPLRLLGEVPGMFRVCGEFVHEGMDAISVEGEYIPFLEGEVCLGGLQEEFFQEEDHFPVEDGIVLSLLEKSDGGFEEEVEMIPLPDGDAHIAGLQGEQP